MSWQAKNIHIIHNKTDEFHVTGILKNGTRFGPIITDAFHALSVNLWKGSVWQIQENGKRKLVKKVGW